MTLPVNYSFDYSLVQCLDILGFVFFLFVPVLTGYTPEIGWYYWHGPNGTFPIHFSTVCILTRGGTSRWRTQVTSKMMGTGSVPKGTVKGQCLKLLWRGLVACSHFLNSSQMVLCKVRLSLCHLYKKVDCMPSGCSVQSPVQACPPTPTHMQRRSHTYTGDIELWCLLWD